MIRIDKPAYGRPEDREALEKMLRNRPKRVECEECGRWRVNHKCPGVNGEACSRSLCSHCGSEEHSL